MHQIKEIFTRFDMFGCDIKLLANGQKFYRTQFGSISTLAIFALLIYSFVIFIQEMNKGKNANLNQYEQNIAKNEGYTFNSNDFEFIVGVLNSAGQVIPNEEGNKIYTIAYSYCVKYLNSTICDSIPAVICGDRIDNVVQALEVEQDYKQISYCIDEKYKSNSTIFRIQGNERFDNYTTLSAQISKCENTTTYQGCASNETINSQIANANLFYIYSFQQFNKENDTNIFQANFNLDVATLNQNVKKYIKVKYQYINGIQEYNPFYFFPQYYQSNGATYQETLVDTALNYDVNSRLAYVEISLNSKKLINVVVYQTLMDVFAQLAGFFQLLKFLFSIFIIPYETFMQKIYLINSYILKQSQNSQDNFINKTNITKLNIFSILINRNQRQLFENLSQKIDKLLDITDVIFNPIKFQANINQLQGSMRRFENEKIGTLNHIVSNTLNVIPPDLRESCKRIDEELPTPFLNQKSEIPSRRISPKISLR